MGLKVGVLVAVLVDGGGLEAGGESLGLLLARRESFEELWNKNNIVLLYLISKYTVATTGELLILSFIEGWPYLRD